MQKPENYVKYLCVLAYNNDMIFMSGVVDWMARKSFGERCNIAGAKLKELRHRISPNFSQNDLAEQLQLLGIDVGKNQIQEMESGIRKISDIELKGLAKFFGITADELLTEDE